MIEDPSYCSFLVRLWCERSDGVARWRGEVEHIQSGTVYEVSSLAEIFSLIGWVVAGREQSWVAHADQARGAPVREQATDKEMI